MARDRRGIDFKVTRNDAERVDIDIYGDIGEAGWWEDDDANVTAREFLDTVREADGKAIDLHINSAGGSVFDACAMMTALRNHNGKVTAHVDGIAASAASWLVAGADEVLIASGAWMMIHDASSAIYGDAAKMRETAEWLDKMDDAIAEIYANRRDAKDKSYYVEAMHETTWYTADEAVEAGLADAVETGITAENLARTFDRATFKTAPEAIRDDIAPVFADSTVIPLKDISTGIIPTTATTAGNTAEANTTAEDGAQERPADDAQERVTRIGTRIVNIRDYRNED